MNNTALLQANTNAVSTRELEIPEEKTKATTTSTPSLIWTENLDVSKMEVNVINSDSNILTQGLVVDDEGLETMDLSKVNFASSNVAIDNQNHVSSSQNQQNIIVDHLDSADINMLNTLTEAVQTAVTRAEPASIEVVTLAAPPVVTETAPETLILNNIKEAGFTTKELERTVMLFSAAKETASSVSDLSRLVIDAVNFPTIAQAAEAMQKNITVNTNVENTTIYTINQVNNSLSNRIHDITGASNLSGVAAGDNDVLEQKQYGAWFMPLYVQVEQKTIPNRLGYK